jgi:diaminopimelate decarboxylase
MSPWWQRGSLSSDARGLTFAGQPLADLAQTQGTPLYVYDCNGVREQVVSLRRALATVGPHSRIYYAIKANRHPAVVACLRSLGDVGIDACSPREVELALAHGFSASEISITSSMPSNSDLAAFAAAGAHVNLDSCSAVRRLAAIVPRGTGVGLRVDPGIRVGYDDAPKVSYGDSKLGIDKNQIAEALDLAHDAGLLVDTLHLHLGWGLQRGAAQAFEQALSLLVGLAPRCPHLRTINVGGGLGARRRGPDTPL